MTPGGQSRSLAWGLATAVGLAAGLAGYVAHAALVNHTPKQVVRVVRLTNAVGMEESPALSPDGKSVAFAAGGRIFVEPLDGGTPVAITESGEHFGPRWSADSSSLIYFAAGSIWEISARGGEARRLVGALAAGDSSHDGKSLAYLRSRNGLIELVVVARDLSGERAIAKLPDGAYSNLRWSPDDGRLAYVSEGEVVVVSVASGELVHVAIGGVQGFAWAPDGSGLIVASARESVLASPPTCSLWFIPRAGDRPSQLTFDESSDQDPDVNPEGDIVVSRVRSHSDVWRFPVTGDPEENARSGVRITRQTGQVQNVALSPDESEVAFLSDSGGRSGVWIARVSDGAMRPLSPNDPNRPWIQLQGGPADGEWKKRLDFGARNVFVSPHIARSRDGKYLYAAVTDVDSDIVMLSGLKWRQK